MELQIISMREAGMTRQEIADELGLPLNTVKTKIRRAKAQLLKMMDYSDELL